MINLNQVNSEMINSKISFPKLSISPISKLKFSPLNRDIIPKHVSDMTTKIRDNGFMDVIKVFKEDKDGTYLVAESQHRIEAIKAIMGNTKSEEVNVPIAILDWVDSEDDEEVRKSIIEMNVGSKGWNVYDYVKSLAKSNNPKARDYSYLLEKLQKYNTHLTNNQVVQTYNSGMIPGSDFKTGLWKLKKEDKEFSDQMLYKISKIVIDLGQFKIKAMFLRALIAELWSYRKKLKSFSYDEQMTKFIKYLEFTYDAVINTVNNNELLPEGEDGTNEFMNKLVYSKL